MVTKMNENKNTLPIIKSCEVCQFGYSWAITPHINNLTEFIFILNGEYTLWTEDCQITAGQGELIYIPNKTLHKDIFKKNSNLNMIFIQFKINNPITDKINIKTVTKLKDLSKNLIDKEFAFIMKEKDISKKLTSLSVMKILTILSSNQKEKPKQKDDKYIDLVQKIKNIIDTEYSKDISLQYISEKVDLSTYHISHIFNRCSEFKLTEYITKTRMGKATELLLNSNYNISQIAYKVGFKDPHYFSNIFKDTYEMTPKEYRNRYKTIKV